MRFRSYLLGVKIVVLALFLFLAYISIGRVALYFIAKTHNLDISYAGYSHELFKRFSFKDLKISDKKIGMGFVSRHATIRPIWSYRSPKDISADFSLSDVRLVRDRDEAQEAYDSLEGLVSVPFASRWRYREISGKMSISETGMHIKELNAVSDEIKLAFTGTIYRDNRIDSDIVIYFSQNLVNKIPEELSKVVLTEEGDGWKSLSVHLGGDLHAPSIQISGRLFRLNIRNISNRP